MRRIATVSIVLAWLLCLPVGGYAQATIAGVVRDISGTKLSGVAVAATSPALIEQVRSVVTDGNGQYKIVDLRPGTYAVIFTQNGFGTMKRDGVELTGSFVATVNADLTPGAASETTTVTGAAGILDVQSTADQRVLDKGVIDNIPTSRSHFSIATTTASVNTNNAQDVGGTRSISLVFLTAHGGRTTDQRVMVEGLSTNSAEGAGQYSGYMINTGSTQEMVVETAGGGAEAENGGVRMNAIPKQGGNRFSAYFALNGVKGGPPDSMATGWLQANNLTPDLVARGLAVPSNIHKLWDVNPAFGGPIVKDKLWFYSSVRYNGQDTYSGGLANLNAGKDDQWLYVPMDGKDGRPLRKTETFANQKSVNTRLTWQVTARNKLSVFYDKQYRCACPSQATPLQLPEATSEFEYTNPDFATITWSSPLTSRLLFEAGASRHPERWHTGAEHYDHAANGGIGPLNLIQVIEQSTGMQYRGATFTDNRMATVRTRGSVSYVTGTHAFKVGYNTQTAWRNWLNKTNGGGTNLSYRFNNGVPNQITQYAYPGDIRAVIPLDLGVFAQDRWTAGKLTATVGVRYDHESTYFPEQYLGPQTFQPTRDLSFPHIDWVNWNDITPRIGVAYDLFGNGKTALKASINKYTLAVGLQGFFGDGSNPIQLYGTSTTRSWNDNFYPVGDPRRGNFKPDCDLSSEGANAECGAMVTPIFRSQPTAHVDPEILHGWGNRGYDWEYSTEVEQQVTSRVAATVGFFRRWYGNFLVQDNAATTAADYTKWSYTVPVDSRLPGGGGYVIDNLYDLNPDKVGNVDKYYTFADKYGKVIEHWNGVDVGVNTRLGSGILLRGGISTGRTVTDNCDVLATSPEISTGTLPPSAGTSITTSPNGVPYCHQNSGFLTQYKAFGTYTIPKATVQVSVNVQNFPGPTVNANINVPTDTVARTLGRPLSGGASNATVNLVAPLTVYLPRVNQIDLKFAKTIRVDRTRAVISVDLFNATNANTVLTANQNYAAWLTPLSILQARFAKIGVQFDF